MSFTVKAIFSLDLHLKMIARTEQAHYYCVQINEHRLYVEKPYRAIICLGLRKARLV